MSFDQNLFVPFNQNPYAVLNVKYLSNKVIYRFEIMIASLKKVSITRLSSMGPELLKLYKQCQTKLKQIFYILNFAMIPNT